MHSSRLSCPLASHARPHPARLPPSAHRHTPQSRASAAARRLLDQGSSTAYTNPAFAPDASGRLL